MPPPRLFRGLFAWLAFTWALPTALADAPTVEQEESHVWALGTLDLIGLGGGRFDGLYASAGAEAHAFVTPEIGFGARVTWYGAGAPDGGACDGVMIGPSIDARLALGTRSRRLWMWGSISAGVITMKGYPYVSEPHFDDRQAFVAAKWTLVEEWKVLMIGGGLEAVMVPTKGVAASPVLVAGFAF